MMAGKAMPSADKQKAPTRDMKSPRRGTVAARTTKNENRDFNFSFRKLQMKEEKKCLHLNYLFPIKRLLLVKIKYVPKILDTNLSLLR